MSMMVPETRKVRFLFLRLIYEISVHFQIASFPSINISELRSQIKCDPNTKVTVFVFTPLHSSLPNSCSLFLLICGNKET